MRWNLSLLPLILAPLLSVAVPASCGEGDAGGFEQQKREAVGVVFSPITAVSEIFEKRRELSELKTALAEKQFEKKIIEKSYENYVREADIERKRAEEIEKKIESLNTLLRTIKGRKAKRATMDKVRELQGKLQQAKDRGMLAVIDADLERKKADDLERKIGLFEEKIESARSKVDKEVKDLYPWAGKIMTFVLLVLVVIIIRIVLLRLINWYVKRDNQKYYYNKIIKVGSWVIVILFIIFILIGHVEHIMLLISFVGAGMAIALKDVITSFFAWFFIMSPSGFRVGDRIEFGDVRGDVVDVGLFRSTLMEIGTPEVGEQAVGRIATFPNNLMFTETLYNFTTGSEFIWSEISFLVTFESNWRRAEELILDITREGSEKVIRKAERKMRSMSRKYMVRFGILTPIVYVRVADSGVELTVRYLTAARMRRVTQDRISRAIIDAINSVDDVDFAYPTIRYYGRGEEPKYNHQ